MPTITKRGLATVAGIPGSFDVIVSPALATQTGKVMQNFEEDIVKDFLGFDAAWNARNEHALGDFTFKLVGTSDANAVAGGVFLAPYATVTLTGFDLASFNGVYQNISGGDIDLSNVKVGDLAVKLRRYADAAQNVLANQVPA